MTAPAGPVGERLPAVAHPLAGRFEPAAGLHWTWPTVGAGGAPLPAYQALGQPPSAGMYQLAREIVAWLQELDASAADVGAGDHAGAGRPGGLMVRWGGPLDAGVVAVEVTRRAGAVPCWLHLHPDDHTDLRWDLCAIRDQLILTVEDADNQRRWLLLDPDGQVLGRSQHRHELVDGDLHSYQERRPVVIDQPARRAWPTASHPTARGGP
jgi:hypothetical protein